jgi:Flp pilus assembly protein CpaB
MVRKLVAVTCLVVLLTSCAQVRREFTGDPVITEGTSVIVSTVDIPAGAALNPLIKGGKFTSIEVPNSAVVPGVVVDISELQGKYATAPIYQNEQIPLARVGYPCPDQICM